MKRAAALLFAALGVACSSDAADPPEPSLSTPGSFVAQEEAPGRIRLLHLRQNLALENGQHVLIFLAIEPRAGSFEAARELAKQPNLMTTGLSSAIESELRTTNWKIVWFRSLRPDERI